MSPAVPNTRCAGCGKAVQSINDGETWHERCYQIHRKKDRACVDHEVCKRSKGIV